MRARELFMSFVMLVLTMIVSACNTAPTYDRDFCGKTVLVVMTKEAGGVNKIHEKETFGKVANQIVEIVDLRYYEDPDSLNINWDNWYQILMLILVKDDKENVLRVVRYLNKLEVVESAEPNWEIKPAG